MITPTKRIHLIRLRFFLPLAVLLPLLIAFLFTGLDCKKDDPIDPGDTTHAPDTTSHSFRWEVDTIGTLYNYSPLDDIWGTSDSNVYGVGYVNRPSGQLPVNIMHWDGRKWTAIEYSVGYLSSIYGFASNDIWAVGHGFGNPSFYGLVAHWDGNSWRTWKFSQYPSLLSIWGTSSRNLYAVGAGGVILKYDGVLWVQVPSGVGGIIKGIWGVSNNEIYAVGNYSETDSGFVLKFDGSRWRKLIESRYKTSKPSGELVAVWSARSNNFLIDSYAGHDSTWEKFGWPNDNTYIDKIRGTGGNNIFACGSFDLIMHFNGKTFKRYDFYKKPYGGRLTGIYVSEKCVFVSGESEDSRGIVYRGYH